MILSDDEMMEASDMESVLPAHRRIESAVLKKLDAGQGEVVSLGHYQHTIKECGEACIRLMERAERAEAELVAAKEANRKICESQGDWKTPYILRAEKAESLVAALRRSEAGRMEAEDHYKKELGKALDMRDEELDRATKAEALAAALQAQLQAEREKGAVSLIERTAQLLAHRACCGTEHDPQNGKFHGNCIICNDGPWPCAYAGKPPALAAQENEP